MNACDQLTRLRIARHDRPGPVAIGGGALATQTTCVALLVIVVVDVFIMGWIAVIGVIGLAMVDLVI